MPRSALPVLRPLVLVLALPFTAMTCTSILTASHAPEPGPARARQASVSRDDAGRLPLVAPAREEPAGARGETASGR